MVLFCFSCLEYYRTPGCQNECKKEKILWPSGKHLFIKVKRRPLGGQRKKERMGERMPRKKDVSRIEAGGKDERRCKERKKERNEGKKKKEETLDKEIKIERVRLKIHILCLHPLLYIFCCLLIHSAMTHLLLPFFSSSNVFDDVKKSSDKIWRYRYYYLVKEYKEQPVLPPPFVFVIHLFEVFQWMVQKCRRPHEITRKCSR